ncbi:hypothetical protein AC249_AIPGENE29137, partial [Exaiptasia diaphana]
FEKEHRKVQTSLRQETRTWETKPFPTLLKKSQNTREIDKENIQK